MLHAAALFFLMRLWPVGNTPFNSKPERTVVHVPYSQFVRSIKQNEVGTVHIDGLTISYALRPTSKLLSNQPADSKNAEIAFSTTRPADYSVPYDVMERNKVDFSAADRRSNHVSLLVSLLNSASSPPPSSMSTAQTPHQHARLR
jgi:hypothetical protein